ncbi:hypothetical protein TIFTF001_006499 [Ficus carica]|uniref:Uncharacterized protein n=1 Tax=Ficus carica TaxID=3494 RepID=A0AA87ZPF0_FICCA|nr:hypothetical protein TIFTF001_006499 [Ficus carica]
MLIIKEMARKDVVTGWSQSPSCMNRGSPQCCPHLLCLGGPQERRPSPSSPTSTPRLSPSSPTHAPASLASSTPHLIPSTSVSKAFYLKMKCDYHRNLAEFKVGDERKS